MPQRTTADLLDLPLKILAILVVGGFLFWLYTTAEPTDVVIEEPEEDPAAETMIRVIRENPGFFEDDRIQISQVAVGARIGLHAFWAEEATENLQNENEDENEPPSILVRVPRELVDQGIAVGEGDTVWVTGFVHQMSDSVLDAWEEDGVFTVPEERGVAAAEDFFLEADGVHTSPPGTEDEEPGPEPANEAN